ncbi:MAG TPA: sulfotransferase [Bacteroidales bacterium]|mgnify:CR=1 FL=1|nr:sulfotransferase [Bacteroidales bacterium]HPI85287.1 sulfotransferase [Bacteroidales bacterium]HPM91460.1 sulfotransferase [Bacteroidales bacterium]
MDQRIEDQAIATLPVFFIIGRPRSGTTLLRLLFEAHPHVLIPPECPFIISLYKKYFKEIDWDEKLIREFSEDVYRQRYFDKWLVDKEVLYQNLLAGKGKTTFREMVKRVELSYRSVYRKEELRMIGDKNPAYSLYPGRILRLFPDAKIIHITRDYRDNYLSLINVNFEVPVVPLVIYRWKFAYRLMQKLKKQHPGQVYSMKYEDLATDPEKTFRDACAFLELDFDPHVLSFYEKKEEVERSYAGSEEIAIVHKSLFNPISTDRMELWKKQMTPRQIRVADLVAGKTAEKAGYGRQYPSFNIFLYLWILPTLVYASLMYRLIRMGDHLPYKWRNTLNKRLGIFLKLYWKFNKRKVKPL